MQLIHEAAMKYQTKTLEMMLKGEVFDIIPLRNIRNVVMGDRGFTDNTMCELAKYHAMDMEAFVDVEDHLRHAVMVAVGLESDDV